MRSYSLFLLTPFVCFFPLTAFAVDTGKVNLACKIVDPVQMPDVAGKVTYITVDFDLQKIIHDTGNHVQEYPVLSENNYGDVLGYGFDRQGRNARILIERVSGNVRADFEVRPDEKSTTYNDKTGKIGFGRDEEVWLGMGYSCQRVTPVF